MTSSKREEYWRKTLKSNKYFICDFIAILFELEKYAFFKIAF